MEFRIADTFTASLDRLKGTEQKAVKTKAFDLQMNPANPGLRFHRIDAEAWATLNSDTSRPFDRPASGRIAVKVINHLGDEVMKVYRVP